MRSLSTQFSNAIRTLIVVTLGATALLLLAFGPRAASEFPKDAVIVDYWEHWSGDEEAAMLAVIAGQGGAAASEGDAQGRACDDHEVGKPLFL